MHALIFGYGQKQDGGIDEQTENRCLKAVDLYRAGKLTKIYITVSASKKQVFMSDGMKNYLLGQGVVENDIVLDKRGRNTAGEMDIFLDLVPSGEKVIFISTWYHIPRIIWFALWRISLNHFSIEVAWRYAHFKADVLVEIKKIARAVLYPISSAKVHSITPSP